MALLPESYAAGASGHLAHSAQIAKKLNRLVYDVKSDYGAVGDGTTNDTAAIQAAIDAVADAGTVFFPTGTYLFSSLTIGSKSVTLLGAGVSTISADVFGGSWTLAGSVLKSTAASGNAISTISNKPMNLRSLGIVGPGSGTAVGVHVTDSVRHAWGNVIVANFATGVRLVGVQDTTAIRLSIKGCSKGLYLDINSNDNSFYGIDISHTTVNAIHSVGAVLNRFYGGVLQSNTGTVVLHDTSAGGGNLYSSLYLENSGATRAVDLVLGDYNQFVACHFGTAGDTLRIASNQNVVEHPQVSQAMTVSGSRNRLIGQFNGAVTLTGSDNSLDGHFGGGITVSSGDHFISDTNGVANHKDMRLKTGKKLYLETSGTSNYIQRVGSGSTEISSATVFTQLRTVEGATVQIGAGAYTPEGNATGNVGDMWLRTNGGAGTCLYIKESGAGTNTGWVAK